MSNISMRDHLLQWGIPNAPTVSAQNEGKFPVLSGLSLPAQALWVARQYLAGESTLVVAKDTRSAEAWQENLEGILGEGEVLSFPAWGVQPYESKEPFSGIVEERLATLLALRSAKPYLVVATVESCAGKLPQPGTLENRMLHFRKGDLCDPQDLRVELVALGFVEQPVVQGVGDFSIRGCIVDINPLLEEQPFRIELFGDEIESIRTFDLFSQKSLHEVDKCQILPMGEFRVNRQELQDAGKRMANQRGAMVASQFQTAWDRGELTDFLWRRTWFESLHVSLFDYAKGATLYWEEPDLTTDRLAALTASWQDSYQKAREAGDPLLSAPADLLWEYAELRKFRDRLPMIGFSQVQSASPRYTQIRVRPQDRAPGGLTAALEQMDAFHAQGGRIWLLAPNMGQAHRLTQLLHEAPVEGVLVGHVTEGMWFEDLQVAFLTEHQIFHRLAHRARKRGVAGSVQNTLDVESLNRGDYVVHRDHGVGRYLGISRTMVDGAAVDCVLLEYADRDRLSFPVSDLHKIERMNLEEDSPPNLHRLGGKAWESAKARVRKRIVEIAKDLVDLYAARQTVEGHAFPPDGPAQLEFEEAFEYEPTPDQVRATSEIKGDLLTSRPMDRLVCGDVGFGKTEVAMRIAFKVVHARKQVCVLAPTTILAAQHYETIRSRFADWPVEVDLVNRYRSPLEKKEVFKKLQDGRIDIVVGTHSLLADTVQFKDLGLLLIDEEQKFGVKQKEKIRKLRTAVDTLSMSATPIPRTLHLSLTGLRDISLINTPPRNRQPVETRVLKRNDVVLTDAVQAELARGGQVFVVYDKVKDIHEVAEQVQRWAPEARLAVAHGQMNDKDLESVMTAFVDREADILLSTTIIESGLDVPNANTIIILNAHHFGMSQLYQMRGRVGRSSVHATAFLVIPAEGEISADASKRLDALERFSDLGSGYQLAMKDLEIRGAGNLLGEEQSGFVEEIGFETYVRMVREVVEELQGKKPVVIAQPRVELGVDAFLPESWIEDGLQRIGLYQKLARLEEPSGVESIRLEMRDRFGPLPEPAESLLVVIECGLWARRMGLQGIQLRKGLLALTFAENPPPDPRNLGEWQHRAALPMRYLMNTPLQAIIELGKGTQLSWSQSAVHVLRRMGG